MEDGYGLGWEDERPGSYFDSSRICKSFSKFGPAGKLPPSMEEGWLQEHKESPMVGCETKEALEQTCVSLGCIAFAVKSRKCYVRLCLPERWVDADDDEEQVFRLDNGPPWHHVDVFYDLRTRNSEFRSYSVQITIEHDIPKDWGLYIALFGGNTNLGHFYGGLQTQVGCPQGPGQGAIEPEKGCIFSRWGPAEMGDVAKCDGSFAECASYEGNFVSVRKHIEWNAGTYTLRLTRRSTNEKPSQGIWVEFEILDHNTEAAHQVGALLFRGDPENGLFLRDHIYNFFEIYTTQRTYADDIPEFQLTIQRPRLNGEPIQAKAIRAVYYKQVPLYASVQPSEHGFGWPLRISFAGIRQSGTPFSKLPRAYRNYNLLPR